MGRQTKPEADDPFDIFSGSGLDVAIERATAAPREERKAPTTAKRSRSSGQMEPAPREEPEAVVNEPPVVVEENVPIKFQVPRSMRAEFQAFKAELGAALGGVVLDDSNLGRAMLDHLLGTARVSVLEAAEREQGSLRRPSNGDPAAMAEFDRAVRSLFGRE